MQTTDKLTTREKIFIGVFLAIVLGFVIYELTRIEPTIAVNEVKSAKAKTEAQIEGKDAERVAITTGQVARNDKHVSDTKKDMKAVDRIVHREPIKDAEYDSMYNVVKNINLNDLK